MTVAKGALAAAYQPPPPPPSDKDTLNVALYPYVPSLYAFAATLWLWWSEGSDIKLRITTYDP